MASTKHIIPWTDGLEYEVPEPKQAEDVFGHEITDPSEQYWRHIPIPNFILMPEDEKEKYFAKELERLVTGVHFWNNGKIEYITGTHYWFLQHWDLGGGKYPKFFYWHKILFWFMDLCRKDNDCFGGQILASKRGGKSEATPCEFLADSMLQTVSTYIMQAQNDIKIKKLFRRSLRAFQSQKRSLPYTYQHFTTNNEILFKNAFTSKKTTKKASKDDISESDHVSIGAYPSKIDFIQGETTRGIFMDEYCSQEQMDMVEWFETAIAQCSEGIGKKIVGKIWLIATPERAKSKSLPFAKKLYKDSDPKKRDENGRTASGLYRMLVPFHQSTPDFLDKHGYPDENAAKQFFENMCRNKSPEKVRELKRKYITCEDDCFDQQLGKGLEADAKNILEARLSILEKEEYTGKAYKLYEYNGLLRVDPTPNNSDDEEEENVIIHEQPIAGVEYEMGIDSIATDKQTTNDENKKSRFALIITKKFHAEGKSYCDVAELVIRPDKLSWCYEQALLLAKHYNITDPHGVRKMMLRMWVEGNAGAAPAVVSFFEAKGCLFFIQRQRKYFGTNNKEELNKLCFIRDENVMATQLMLLNAAAKMYGHNFNSRRLIRSLLQTGTGKTDIGDAFQASILGWEGFHLPFTVKKTEPRYYYKTIIQPNGTFARIKTLMPERSDGG